MALIKHSERTVRKPCKGCGSTDLYWAHDTDKPYGKSCERCGTNGKFAMINKDGTKHMCFGLSGQSEVEPEHGETEPAPVPALVPAANGSEVKVQHAPDADKLSALSDLLDVLAPKVDAQQVREMITEQNSAFVADLMVKFDRKIADVSVPVRVRIETPAGTRDLPDVSHKILPTILKVVGNARKHVLMVGPAGTGKSTIAEQVANALDLPYHSISLSPQTTASALLGYMQAEGKYVRTAYREAYENGGVFHFDEMDNAHPSILATINASLSNGSMGFPDGQVKRHADFRVMASANTFGRGADRVYVGRQQLDGATLDRFVTIPVEIDEALELAICTATGLALESVHKVLRYVRQLRRNIERHKMPVVMSPRGSEGMCALLAVGLSVDQAIDYRVRKGLSDQDWSKISSDVGKPII